ncbi:MAG: LLM class flavin-dependent oxidoreductase [Candidatus Thorarchaeota archaeon]
MKFFIGGLGNWFNDYTQLKQLILEGDKLGFDGALMPDHYMWGTMGGRMNRPDRYRTVDTWITLSYLAGKTEHIKLGTLVTPIPFRPPGMLAKMLSTLDNLSNGRVILGVGAGWSQDEFDGFSQWSSDKERVDKTKEGLELILKLWTQEEVNFEGNFFNATKAVIDPKPVQNPYPELLFGGSGNRMLKLAGKYGNIIYIPPWGGPEKIAEGRKKVLKSAKENNREDKIAFMSGTMMGPRTTNVKEFTGLIESAVANKDKYFLPSFGRGEDAIKLMKEFAKEIIPSYK